MKYLLILLALAGCTPKQDAKPGQRAYDYQDLRTYEDKERGVVCFRVRGYEGLSCLQLTKENK